MMPRSLGWAGACALAGALAAVAQAQAGPTQQQIAESKAAWADAAKVAIEGPAEIPLAGEAKLALPAGQAFVPRAQANRLMRAMGNSDTPSRLGLILPDNQHATWVIDVGWIKEGYVRDGEAKEWKADALLQSLREGTEAGNSDRVARGFPALDVVGWAEPPAYDAGAHRLVWSLLLREKTARPGDVQTVNYNTYALGREGYFELDLLTDAKGVGADKKVVRDLLGHLEYLPGKRYSEFNPSTDKVAAYGIGALIGVVAAKKIGLLAALGIFLLKVWKLGLVAIAGVGAAVRKFFRRNTPQA